MHPRLLVALALGVGVSTPASAAEPAPYRLVVVVDWGARSGPESLRQELTGELATELQRRECFRSVKTASDTPAAAHDLVLRVVVDGYEEEVEYGYAIADRSDVAQETVGQAVAHVKAWFDAEVRTADDGVSVRRHRFRQGGTWRPLMHEDPRPEALRNLVVNAVRSVRKFACKGSPAKWAEQLQRARSEKSR